MALTCTRPKKKSGVPLHCDVNKFTHCCGNNGEHGRYYVASGPKNTRYQNSSIASTASVTVHYFTAEERRPAKWTKFVRRHYKGFSEYVEGHPF